MLGRPCWLVCGADGAIGAALCESLRDAGRPLLATSRRPAPGKVFLDLDGGLKEWRPPRPVSHAFLCAAVTDLAACRRDPERTRKVNVSGNATLADLLTRQGAFVVFPSTNLVLAGGRPFPKGDEALAPLTEYGRQKAEAESRILALRGHAAVVRLAKVVTPGLPLLKGWVESLRARRPIRPFRDMPVAPVSLSLTVRVLELVAGRESSGIFQLSARADMSWAEAALHVARRLDAPSSLVQPWTTAEAGYAEEVPSHSALDCSRLQDELGIEAPDPRAALDEFLAA